MTEIATPEAPLAGAADPFVAADPANPTAIINAIFAPTPGIVIDPTSIVIVSSPGSISFYDGSLTALGLGSGLLITSGTVPGVSNTVGWFGADNGMAGDADLDAVINKAFATTSYDATSISLNFTVTDPTITGISFNIVFGTDEYPEWVDQFVDIAVVMVNGVNVAYFGNDPNAPLSVISQNLAAGYFIDNADSHLPTEYDGVSHVLTVYAPVHLGSNSLKIAIADTGDHIYDSGLFISNLTATNIPATGVSQDLPCTTGDDTVTGGAASESIDGLGGDDHLNGGGGDDILKGGLGADSLQGGDGKDFLDGGAGHDLISGGAGDDTLQFAGDDVLDGGDGQDTLLLDLSGSGAAATLDLSHPDQLQTLPDGSTLINIEALTFLGGSGNDQVTGGAMADSLSGGAGDDRLAGGGGNDRIDGGDGTDVAVFSGGSANYLVTTTPDGLRVEDLRAGSPDGVDILTGVETLRFSDGDFASGGLIIHGETITGTGDDDVVSGVDGPAGQPFATALGDQIQTLEGDDIVDSLGGDDTVDLGDGNDIAHAGAGDDTVTGGLGSDEIWGDEGTDTVVFSGNKADYLVAASGDGFTVTDLRAGSPDGLDQLVGVEFLAFADKTVKLTVGAPPSFDSGDYADGLTEPAAPSGISTLTGAIQFSDADHDDTHTLAVVASDGVQTGVTFSASMAADTDGENPGQITWSLDVDTAAIDVLAEGQVRTLTYTLRLTDGAGNAVDQDVVITLTGTNDAPVVSGPVLADVSPATGPVTVDGLDHVSDIDLGAKPHIAGPPAVLPAGVTFDALNQTFTLDPTDPALLAVTGGGNAVIHVDYVVTDGIAQTNARVTFNLTGGNIAPVVSGPVSGGTFGEDAGASGFNLLANATDANPGDTLSVKDGAAGVSVSLTAGTWASPLSFTLTGGTFGFDPAQFNSLGTGETLSYRLDYKVSDGAGGLADAEAVFTVQGANDAPDAFALSASHVNEGAAPGSVIGLLSGHDPDRTDSLSYAIASDPSGLFAVAGGQLVVAPGANLSAATVGDHVVNLTASDGHGGSFPLQVTVSVDSTHGATIVGTKLADRIDATHAPAGQPFATNAGDQISGGAGDDIVDGLGGGDTLRGEAGNDSLTGGQGADRLDGGLGVDQIDGGAGDDTIVIRGTEAAGDTFLGGETEEALGDTVEVAGATAATLAGFDAAARGIERWAGNGQGLLGGVAADRFDLSGLVQVTGLSFVDAGAGADQLIGSAFADDLRGGSGNDSLTGGQGADRLDGGVGVDQIDGGAGDDTIVIRGTEAQDDVLQGGETGETLGDAIEVAGLAAARLDGFDAAASGIERWIGNGQGLLGGATGERFDLSGLTQISGLSFVDGGAGADVLIGSAFADDLRGGSGNDELDGGAGEDILTGGTGNDLYHVNSAGDQVIELAAGGTDTVMASINYSLAGTFIENLTLVGAIGLTGVGNSLNNLMTGSDGNDSLDGGDGRDTLDGGAGDDTLIGGLGDDLYRVDSSGDVIVEAAGGGRDTVMATAASYTLAANLEVLTFAGTGAFAGTGNDEANTITGGDGADSLDGAGGDDRLFGGLSDDSLTGGAGKDNLDGGAGADQMAGGADADVYFVDDSLDQIIELAGGGIDTARVTAAAYTLADEVENLTYAGVGDFAGTGNALVNVMTGGNGADSLSGLGGADRLTGGAGDDHLIGGAGADMLVGGLGADVFVYQAASDSLTTAQDKLTDFSQADGDRIDLSLIDADPSLAGDQDFSFLGLGAFTHHAGEVRYAIAGGATTISIDINGDGVADMAMRLTGAIDLTAADFFL